LAEQGSIPPNVVFKTVSKDYNVKDGDTYAYQATSISDPNIHTEELYVAYIWKAIQDKGDTPVYVSAKFSGFMGGNIDVLWVAVHHGATDIYTIVIAVLILLGAIVAYNIIAEVYYVVTGKEIPTPKPIDITTVLMIGLLVGGLYLLSKRGER
jgi:hypothetical protein